MEKKCIAMEKKFLFRPFDNPILPSQWQIEPLATVDILNENIEIIPGGCDHYCTVMIKSSVLKKVGTKQYIVMTFNSGNMFTAMQASIKGKDVETKFEKIQKKNKGRKTLACFKNNQHRLFFSCFVFSRFNLFHDVTSNTITNFRNSRLV